MSLHRDDVRKLRAVLKAAAAQTELVERRTELLERAVEGLTDEQIEAIPRLVRWFTIPTRPGTTAEHEAWRREWEELERLFPSEIFAPRDES